MEFYEILSQNLGVKIFYYFQECDPFSSTLTICSHVAAFFLDSPRGTFSTILIPQYTQFLSLMGTSIIP